MFFKQEKMKAFVAVCIPLALAKFWQETVYLMSYFLEHDIGVPASVIMDTAKYQPLGVALGYTFSAILVDRIGIKKILSLCLVLMGVEIFLFSQTTSLYMLYVHRLVMGMFISFVYTCSFGALPILFDDQTLPKKTSVLYMFAFASTIVSPLLFTNTQQFFSWRVLLLCMMVLTMLSGIAVRKYFPQHTQNTTVAAYFGQARQLTKNKIFLLMAIVSTLCMGGFYGFVCIFAQNLKMLNISSEVSKFIIADMQFVSRLILFVVITWSGYKLTKEKIPTYLKACLMLMGVASVVLLYFLLVQGSLFAKPALLNEVVALAGQSKHVFTLFMSSFSGVWMFWLYAALMGIAQPANKSKALSIAGKSVSGAAQATLGFCLSIGEFFFAGMATYAWPIGAAGFLVFVIFAAMTVVTGMHRSKHKL